MKTFLRNKTEGGYKIELGKVTFAEAQRAISWAFPDDISSDILQPVMEAKHAIELIYNNQLDELRANAEKEIVALRRSYESSIAAELQELYPFLENGLQKRRHQSKTNDWSGETYEALGLALEKTSDLEKPTESENQLNTGHTDANFECVRQDWKFSNSSSLLSTETRRAKGRLRNISIGNWNDKKRRLIFCDAFARNVVDSDSSFEQLQILVGLYFDEARRLHDLQRKCKEMLQDGDSATFSLTTKILRSFKKWFSSDKYDLVLKQFHNHQSMKDEEFVKNMEFYHEQVQVILRSSSIETSTETSVQDPSNEQFRELYDNFQLMLSEFLDIYQDWRAKHLEKHQFSNIKETLLQEPSRDLKARNASEMRSLSSSSIDMIRQSLRNHSFDG
jgi:hypothetical protein